MLLDDIAHVNFPILVLDGAGSRLPRHFGRAEVSELTSLTLYEVAFLLVEDLDTLPSGSDIERLVLDDEDEMISEFLGRLPGQAYTLVAHNARTELKILQLMGPEWAFPLLLLRRSAP